jgi:hypothetical protein
MIGSQWDHQTAQTKVVKIARFHMGQKAYYREPLGRLKEECMSSLGNVEVMPPPMGKQIEYEIYYGKTPEEHPEVHLSLGKEDSIHWFCSDHRFRVVSVYPDPKRTPNAPVPLFYRRFPEDNLKFAYHVNSGPARAEVGESNWYKPIFEFEDLTTLDPHIQTGP